MGVEALQEGVPLVQCATRAFEGALEAMGALMGFGSGCLVAGVSEASLL